MKIGGTPQKIVDGPKAEEQLRSLVGYTRSLIEASLDPLVTISAEGKITDVNEATVNATGVARAELIGTDFSGYFTDPAMARRGYQRGFAEGRVTDYPLTIRHRDGGVMHVLYNASVYRDGDGKVLGVFAAARDVTGRKQAEEALRANEERYRSLFENMLNGFAYCRMIFEDKRPVDFVYLAVNAAFARLTGLTDVVGRRVTEVIPGIREADPRLFEIYGRVARTGQPEVFETYVEALANWFFISVYCPKPDHFVAVFDVITGRKETEGKLRLFRELIERTGDAIEVVDPVTGRFLDVNEAACRMLGYPRAELLTRTIFDVERALDRPAFETIAARLAKAGSLTIETRHWRKDGSQVPVEISLSAVQLDRPYAVTIVRDITDRRRAEAALRESEQRFRTLVDHAPEAVFVGTLEAPDAEPRFAYANAAAVALFGATSPAELVGRPVLERVHPDSREKVRGHLRELQAREQVGAAEITCLRLDGTSVPVELSVTSLHFQGRKGAVIFARDVRERKRAETKIREQAALLEHASDAIYVTGLDCTIFYWNAAAARVYGWSAAEAVGRKTTALISGGESNTAEALATVLAKGEWTGERQQKKRSGQPLVVASRLTLLRDERGQPHSILVINTDVTDRKQLEAQFLRAQRLESVGALASGMAHDLNNVLAPIMMGVPLLREAVRDETAQNLLTMVEASARRGAEIVRQVLTFARGTPDQRAPLQLGHLVREMVRMAEQTFPKNIAIASAVGTEVRPVEADVTQVHQALMNLCVNARDAMPDGGKLTLAVDNAAFDERAASRIPGAAAGAFVRLAVTDSGTGIPPEVQDRIFEPFFTTKGVGKGTGLGLSTVLGIVKGHGGFIRVDSRVGQGTTFELFFPASTLPRPTRAPGPARTAVPWPRADGEQVLVVDDEAAVREVARQALEEFGYRVMVCATGAEAVQLFRATRADVRLVVTDMMMPEMDGPTLVGALRAFAPNVRIVGITGALDPPTTSRLQALSLAAVLTKPFTVGELLNAVSAAAKS